MGGKIISNKIGSNNLRKVRLSGHFGSHKQNTILKELRNTCLSISVPADTRCI
jgi:hypothetical protein